ncbi:MAG: hypothetical protein JOZ78_23090 [Chroococcidiopsidaceae cyanobacterium CP_BM_ER_R8_30]|nr:hypothetical protein [Chroococcidiopsidaceae cyanobacterium CP_BM_ER_R8_30]
MTEKPIGNNAGGFLILILPIAVTIVFLFTTWPLLLALVVFSISFNVWQRYQWQKWSQQVNPIFHQLIQANRGCITPLDLALKANFSAETAKRYLDSKAEEFGAQRQEHEDRGTMYYFITASTLGTIFDDSEPQDSVTHSSSVSLSPAQRFAGGSSSDSLEQAQGLAGSGSGDSRAQAQSTAMTDNVQERAEGTQVLQQVQMPSDSLIQTESKQTPSDSLIQAELAKRLDVHSSTVYKRRADPDFPEWSRSRDPEGIAWKYSPATKDFVPLLNQ